MPQDKPYDNAPLELVLVEIAHPLADRLDAHHFAALKTHLMSVTPIQHIERSIEFSGDNPAPNTVVEFSLGSRDRRSQIVFQPNAILVQTTNYSGWTRFRELIRAAVLARQAVSPIDGVERIGLRYIDEVRVPSASGTPIWSEWVSDRLTGPSSVIEGLGFSPAGHQGQAQFRSQGSSDQIALRYGAAVGQVVQSSPTLIRRAEAATQHFFLLDTDASWSLRDDEYIVPADIYAIMETCDRLHQPIQELFESLITAKLRDEVLNDAVV